MSKKEYQYKDKLPRSLKFLGNLSHNTRKSYFQAIRKYEEYHNLDIEALICEALEEQTNQVPPHQLKVIERIEDFQEHLIEEDLVHGTIRNHVGRIKSIYHKNRVMIPYIEPLNPKRTRRREYIEYKDVLSKDELRKALQYMRLPAQARLMTMIQGGLSNKECDELQTRTFLDELYKYHQQDDDIEALKWLSDENHPVIWVTKLIRIKTGKPYYAIIGSEAVNKIAEAKLYESRLPKNQHGLPSKLLDMNIQSFGRVCREVNSKCNFGKVAEESKLRPHNLRRFHATYIRGSALTYEEKVSISLSEIDEMQGRGKTNVQDTYIKSNPLEQKLLYAKVMNNVSLFHEYEYTVSSDDIHVFVKDQSVENEKLRLEVQNLRKNLQNKHEASEKVKALKKELGNDTFQELIGEILNAS